VQEPLRRFLFIVAVSVAVAGDALAGTAASGLHLSGRVSADMGSWVRQAGENVPLPNARLTVRSGSARFEGKTIYLPAGASVLAIRGLFLHELGHAYDAYGMTPERRQEFLRIASVTCTWTSLHCRTARWVSGPGVYVDVRPQEMFAEMYAACALGLTERGYQDAGYRTYGWVPPDGTDAALCSVVHG